MPSYYTGIKKTSSTRRQRQPAHAADRDDRRRARQVQSRSPPADRRTGGILGLESAADRSHNALLSVESGSNGYPHQQRSHYYDADVSDLDLDRMDLDSSLTRDRFPDPYRHVVMSPSTATNISRRRRRDASDDDEETVRRTQRQVRPRVRSPVRPSGNYAAPSYFSDASSDHSPQGHALSPATILRRSSKWSDEDDARKARSVASRHQSKAWRVDFDSSEDENAGRYVHHRRA